MSYLGGLKTYSNKIFLNNMTTEEERVAGAIFFHLGSNVPEDWGLDKDLVLDLPVDKRSIVEYRTTLAHKVNCKQNDDINAMFSAVRHPFLGPIACLVATEEIMAGEEIYLDYLYDRESDYTPEWYKLQSTAQEK